MKKEVFNYVSALLICCQFSAKAQSWGIKAGANFSQISSSSYMGSISINQNSQNNTGYVVGVWGRYGEKFFIQPEIVVGSKGGTISILNSNTKVKLTTIDVPVLVGIKLFEMFRVNLGPVASLKIGENSDLNNALTKLGINNGVSFNDFSFGYQAGIGLSLGIFEFDLRRMGALSEISEIKTSNSSNINQKIMGYQVSVGLKLK